MVKEPTVSPHSQPSSLNGIPKTFHKFAMKCKIHCLTNRNEHMMQHTPKLSKKMVRAHSMYRGEVYTGFWWRKLRERDHLKDSGIDGRIILKWIFRKWDKGHGLD